MDIIDESDIWFDPDSSKDEDKKGAENPEFEWNKGLTIDIDEGGEHD